MEHYVHGMLILTLAMTTTFAKPYYAQHGRLIAGQDFVSQHNGNDQTEFINSMQIVNSNNIPELTHSSLEDAIKNDEGHQGHELGEKGISPSPKGVIRLTKKELEYIKDLLKQLQNKLKNLTFLLKGRYKRDSNSSNISSCVNSTPQIVVDLTAVTLFVVDDITERRRNAGTKSIFGDEIFKKIEENQISPGENKTEVGQHDSGNIRENRQDKENKEESTVNDKKMSDAVKFLEIHAWVREMLEKKCEERALLRGINGPN